jgi:hypothetical protein
MTRQPCSLHVPDVPRDDADAEPTRFGNALPGAAEHPVRTYAMDGALWRRRGVTGLLFDPV